jgi:hypothetical protein
MSLRRAAILFLVAQGLGASVWWIILFAWPESHRHFRAHDAPDSTLLAFAVADGLLFIGTSFGSAIGCWKRRRWAWPVLCVHTGAACYAALYCWSLTVLTGGDAWLGAVLMTPSLVVPPALAWLLRPRGEHRC